MDKTQWLKIRDIFAHISDESPSFRANYLEAIKSLPGYIISIPDARARLKQAAQILGSLFHPRPLYILFFRYY